MSSSQPKSMLPEPQLKPYSKILT